MSDTIATDLIGKAVEVIHPAHYSRWSIQQTPDKIWARGVVRLVSSNKGVPVLWIEARAEDLSILCLPPDRVGIIEACPLEFEGRTLQLRVLPDTCQINGASSTSR